MAGLNVDFVHQLTYNLCAKQSVAFPSPANWDGYATLAQSDLYNYYNDERAKLLLKVKAGETLQIPSALQSFIVNEVALTNTAGVLNQPSGYRYDLDMTANGVDIKRIDFDRRNTYINSTIDPPSATFPIYCETATGFLVYPIGTTPCLLTYIKDPVPVHWGYILSGGRPVYDPNTSVDFIFQGPELLRVVSRILNYMSVSIRDIELEQEAKKMLATAS